MANALAAIEVPERKATIAGLLANLPWVIVGVSREAARRHDAGRDRLKRTRTLDTPAVRWRPPGPWDSSSGPCFPARARPAWRPNRARLPGRPSERVLAPMIEMVGRTLRLVF